MTSRIRRVAVGGVLAIFAVATVYLLTLGQCFLPHWGVENHRNEQLEMREYSPFILPARGNTVGGILGRVKWTVMYPGRAKVLSAAEMLQMQAPKEDHNLREVLEKMGYSFPPGCAASSGDVVPGWRITHYPSVLNRIERDLHLSPHWVWAVEQDGAANGSQPFSSATNTTSSSAGSRR